MRRIRKVPGIAARLVEHRWGWAEREAARIAAHWARRTAERPAMFNGRILMLAGMEQRPDEVVEARFFETDYANLTTWLDLGQPDREARNGFAMGALSGSEGAFILGRMGQHTAAAGRLYFPAGTPDRTDVRADSTVDLAGSLLREITEETGLGAADWRVEAPWTILEEGQRVAFMRRVRLHASAAEARRRIRAFLAREERPELSDVEIVTSETEFVPGMPDFVKTYLRAAWAGQIE